MWACEQFLSLVEERLWTSVFLGSCVSGTVLSSRLSNFALRVWTAAQGRIWVPTFASYIPLWYTKEDQEKQHDTDPLPHFLSTPFPQRSLILTLREGKALGWRVMKRLCQAMKISYEIQTISKRHKHSRFFTWLWLHSLIIIIVMVLDHY